MRILIHSARERKQIKMGGLNVARIVAEMHKNRRVRFPRKHFEMFGIDDTWEADLTDLGIIKEFNDNITFMLVVVDVFSKFAFARPLKSKNMVDVTIAFRSILESSKRCPRNLHTDKGTDFHNKQMKKMYNEYNINHYITQSDLKATMVERLNRTLKGYMYKYFHEHSTYRWVDDLQMHIDYYNSKYHSKIKMAPNECKKEHEQHLLDTVYNYDYNISDEKPKFKLNDFVRISTKRGTFFKAYEQNFGSEIFQIVDMNPIQPETYYLKDYKGERIVGAFYKEELTKVADKDGYLIEKVIRKRGDKVLVKWQGFSDEHNTWENIKDVKDLI